MTRPIRILELRSVWGTGGGPDKTILLGAARADRDRFAVTVCYIRDVRDETFTIDVRARAAGLDYVEIPERHSFDYAVWPALRRLVRERRIDIVHAHEHKTDLLALLLSHAEAVAPLATAHGWSGLSRRERLYYHVDRRLLARYPLVVAVSEPIRQSILARGAAPARVRRVPNGIDHLRFRRTPGTAERMRRVLDLPAGRRIVGAVGRLETVKRFDLLLAAVARIDAARRPVVVVAGAGPLEADLRVRAQALGLAGDVRLLGHRDDALDVHQAFDVYVQTSDSEGVPNAVLEAMALETPVVATDVGGTRDLITNETHGLLVPRRNPDAIAAAVSRALTDRFGARQRAVAARRRVECELSFDARMQTVEAIYEELAGRQQPAAARERVAPCA